GAGEGARPGGPQVHPAWTDATRSLRMSRISSPWSGSGAGEYRRSRGGGAARRAAGSPRLNRSHPVLAHVQEFFPVERSRSGGAAAEPGRGRGPEGRRFTPPEPTPPGPCTCPGFLPRGAVAERGSTGGAGEGARPGGPQVHPAWTDATQSL